MKIFVSQWFCRKLKQHASVGADNDFCVPAVAAKIFQVAAASYCFHQKVKRFARSSNSARALGRGRFFIIWRIPDNSSGHCELQVQKVCHKNSRNCRNDNFYCIYRNLFNFLKVHSFIIVLKLLCHKNIFNLQLILFDFSANGLHLYLRYE